MIRMLNAVPTTIHIERLQDHLAGRLRGNCEARHWAYEWYPGQGQGTWIEFLHELASLKAMLAPAAKCVAATKSHRSLHIVLQNVWQYSCTWSNVPNFMSTPYYGCFNRTLACVLCWHIMRVFYVVSAAFSIQDVSGWCALLTTTQWIDPSFTQSDASRQQHVRCVATVSNT